MPWNNLGCLGINVEGRFYLDVFKRWGPWYQFGAFHLDKRTGVKTWYTFPVSPIREVKRIDPRPVEQEKAD
jgi:hypothetical protein